MQLDIKNFYEEHINKTVISDGISPMEINFEIKVVCFFNAIRKKYSYLKAVDYSGKANFKKTIDANIELVGSDHSLAEVFKEIREFDRFHYSEIFNEIDSLLDNETDEFNSELFDCADENSLFYSRGESSTCSQLIKSVLCLISDHEFKNVLDLCSGEGRFLNEFSKAHQNAKLYGYEVNSLSILISKMRLLMNDKEICITQLDVLGTSLGETYDLVFANYPIGFYYSAKVLEDKNNIVDYSSKTSRSDWNFIFKAINSTNIDGKTAVIAPAGVLSNLPEKNKRKQIIDKGLLEEIVFLPAGINRYTGVAYVILVFSQNIKHESVKFVDARECILNTKGALKQIDFKEFSNFIKSNNNEYVKDVTYDEIIKYNYNLGAFPQEGPAISFEKTIKLKDFANVFTGFQYTSKNMVELDPGKGNVSIARIANMNDGDLNYDELISINADEQKIENYYLKENDIILSSKGTTDKVAIIKDIGDKKIIPYNNLLVIRIIDNKINPVYLYSFLNSVTGKMFLKTVESGSVIKNINKGSLLELEVPYFDIDTQETIANRFILLKKEIIKEKEKLTNMENKLNSIFEEEAGV